MVWLVWSGWPGRTPVSSSAKTRIADENGVKRQATVRTKAKSSAPGDRTPGVKSIPSNGLAAQLADVEQALTGVKEQLRRSQRLASLGTSAAMLAHEYNNVMTPLIGYAKRALSTNDPEMMIKALQTTLKQSEVVVGMSERILGMAADQPIDFKNVPLRALVQDAHDCLCRDLAKDGITFALKIGDNVTVWADAKQIQQVFFNLILNARDALQDRTGRVAIKVTNVQDDSLEISVTDDGCGIEPEVCESIFEPFFSTKRNTTANGSGGFGLGLALCRDIIEAHNGTIRVQSTANKGTTFAITLPTSA